MDNYFNQKGISIPKIIIGIIVAIIGIVILMAIFGGEKPTKVGELPKEEVKTEAEKPKTETLKTQTFSIGEKIKLGDYILTVNSIEHCISRNEFIQPTSGNKFIVADISQENAGSAPRDYNLWYFTLQDNKDYSYQTAILPCKEPLFGYGTLQPGMKTRGYITFEIPTGNQPSRLIFTPGWWTTSQIIVEIK